MNMGKECLEKEDIAILDIMDTAEMKEIQKVLINKMTELIEKNNDIEIPLKTISYLIMIFESMFWVKFEDARELASAYVKMDMWKQKQAINVLKTFILKDKDESFYSDVRKNMREITVTVVERFFKEESVN